MFFKVLALAAAGAAGRGRGSCWLSGSGRDRHTLAQLPIIANATHLSCHAVVLFLPLVGAAVQLLRQPGAAEASIGSVAAGETLAQRIAADGDVYSPWTPLFRKAAITEYPRCVRNSRLHGELLTAQRNLHPWQAVSMAGCIHVHC